MGGLFKPLRGNPRRLRYGIACVRPVRAITTAPSQIRGVLGRRVSGRRIGVPIRRSGRVPPVGALAKILRRAERQGLQHLLN